MSKLHAALKKLSSSRESKPAVGEDESLGTTSPARSGDRHRSSETRVRAEKTISIDRQKLIEAGVTVDEEYEQELRDEMRRIKWPVVANAFGEQSATIPSGNVVMVGSATSGEGKTFTTINLALSIAAEKDHDVLLVDADIAKPHASEIFGIAGDAGVIDYLTGEAGSVEDIVIGTDVPGLSLLSAGCAHEHASELMASNRMTRLVAELTEKFPETVILFDTSPILQTNESQVLSRIVGQILLVVAANKTSQAAASEAAEIIGTDRVVNVIFNGVNSVFRHKYRYGGYYGYQSRR